MPARRWFPLAALALGLALPVAAELGLRASGRFDGPAPTISGEHGSFRVARGAARGDMLTPYTGPDGQRWWRTPAREVAEGRMLDQRFAEAKAPGTLRVFTFGGSAALGVPLERTPARTFPARLAAHLAALGIRAEVINLGGASYGTDHVRVLATQAAGLGADLLVVYAGNNEFFHYNMALWDENRGWWQHAQALEGLHLQRALRQLLGRPLPAVGAAADSAATGDLATEQRALVREVLAHRIRAAGPAALPTGLAPAAGPGDDSAPPPERQDPIFQAVRARYQANLEAVARLAEDNGPRVLLAEIPANLHEPPWLSLHGPPDALGRVDGGPWEAAVATVKAEGCAAALPALDAAVAASPLHAASRFQRGICREQTGQPGAVADLRAALALDMDPGRPPDAFRAVLRARGDRPGVTAVDLAPAFPPAADGRWFHDSCHLTADGQDHLAATLAAAAVSALL